MNITTQPRGVEKLKHYALLMRLNRPIGIFLLLWPTLWALWLAGKGRPAASLVAIFITGVILMRSAGCIINDIADRKFDAYVERTRKRPLAMGVVTVKEAMGLFTILMLAAFILVLFLNGLTLILACLGALFAMAYPFMKRVTHLPQVGLGVAFSWGIPMAFAATLQTVSFQGWLLFFAAAVWPIIYDTLYAMVDRADDLNIGIKSTAILFGKWDRLIIGFLQIIFLILLLIVGYFFKLNIFYYVGILIAGILFIYQQILIKNRLSNHCFRAFLNNNWVGLVIFIAILLAEKTSYL